MLDSNKIQLLKHMFMYCMICMILWYNMIHFIWYTFCVTRSWALTILSYNKKLFTHDTYCISYDTDNYDNIYSIVHTMYELSLYLRWTNFFPNKHSFFVSTFLLMFTIRCHKCYKFFSKYNIFRVFPSCKIFCTF